MKKNVKYSALLAGLLLSAVACKKDKPYTAPVIEGSQVIEMGATYENQVYVKLSTQTVTSKPVNSWDLAFESNGGNAVKVNTGKKSAIYVSSTTDFASVTAAPASGFVYDDPSGDLSATAIGQWADNGTSRNLVYIVNLGNNPPSSATNLGFKKFQIKSFDSGKYTLRFANLDGTAEQTVEIPVNTIKNFTYYSFSAGVVDVEPDKNQWDLMFVGATVAGGGPPGSYVVSPATVSNRYNGVTVAVDNPASALTESDDPNAEINLYASSNSRYGIITKADVFKFEFKEDAMTIGSNWRQILTPHSSGNYKIYDWKTYIVKDTEGKYFKIRFTAFKNLSTGAVGYPSFEYTELQ